MLTPKDIQDVGFAKSVFGGYDMESVDDFLDIVAADYAKLYKDNAVLKSKIKVLVDKIEEYRQTEDSMRMALLTAQRTSEELLNRAKDKSSSIVAGAEAQAEAKLHEIEKYIAMENTRLIKAQQDAYEFVKQSKKLLEIYSLTLSKMETSEIIFPDTKVEMPRIEEEGPAKEPEYEPSQVEISDEPDIAEEPTEDTAHQEFSESVVEASQEEEPVSEDMFSDIENAIRGRLSSAEKETTEKEEDLDETKFFSSNSNSKTKRDFENLRFGSNYSNSDN